MTDETWGDFCLIWSNEHRAWWGPGGTGYSRGLNGAGRYTRAQAIDICAKALMTAAHIGMISEVPVRLADVHAMLRDRAVPEAVYGNDTDHSVG